MHRRPPSGHPVTRPRAPRGSGRGRGPLRSSARRPASARWTGPAGSAAGASANRFDSAVVVHRTLGRTGVREVR